MQGFSGIRATKFVAPPHPHTTEAPLAVIKEADCVEPENLADDRTFRESGPLLQACDYRRGRSTGRRRFSDARYDPAEVAVLFGSSTGGLLSLEQSYIRVYRDNASRIHPMTIPRFMGSSPASAITQTFGITGPAWCASSACASSAHAISEAAWYIRTGRSQAVIAGGTESSLSFGHVMAWQCLGALASDTCRPFSIGRTGMALAEGAAVLVLENYDSGTTPWSADLR